MQNIEDMYEEYSQIIYKYIFCLTKNHELSEEIVQDTFLVAVKNIDKFEGKSKLTTWLCAIAKNIYYKKIKKMKNGKIIIIIMFIILLIFALYSIFVVYEYINNMKVMEIFFQENVSDEKINEAKDIIYKIDENAEIIYKSSEEALKDFKDKLSSDDKYMLEGYEKSNLFPSSLLIKTKSNKRIK